MGSGSGLPQLKDLPSRFQKTKREYTNRNGESNIKVFTNPGNEKSMGAK